MTSASTDRQLSRLLALNRTVAVVLLSVLFFGLGEQLWSPFMPLYLTAEVKELKPTPLGAREVSALALWMVGAYAALRNLFEGFCYVGGGRITAWLGDRGSLLLFGMATVSGYILFLAWEHPVGAVMAALLILGWEPLSVPVTFTTVGSTVERSRQGMAFALQSIQKRLPKIIGPVTAGFVLSRLGPLVGMRVLVSVSLVLGVVSLALQILYMPQRDSSQGPGPLVSGWTILRTMHPTLRRLLLAEVFTRWCDWLVREFVVLYVVLVRGVSLAEVGGLMALQHLTALLTYLPVGGLTRKTGLQPFVGATFVFFALFPLALAWVPDGWMVVAFVIYGLREIGEPARKALITSTMDEEVRARGVGLYWGVRAFAICPAALAGAGIWYAFGPQALLYTAFGCGCVGAAVFYLLCRSPLTPHHD
jgi:hypothetical protein